MSQMVGRPVHGSVTLTRWTLAHYESVDSGYAAGRMVDVLPMVGLNVLS